MTEEEAEEYANLIGSQSDDWSNNLKRAIELRNIAQKAKYEITPDTPAEDVRKITYAFQVAQSALEGARRIAGATNNASRAADAAYITNKTIRIVDSPSNRAAAETAERNAKNAGDQAAGLILLGAVIINHRVGAAFEAETADEAFIILSEIEFTFLPAVSEASKYISDLAIKNIEIENSILTQVPIPEDEEPPPEKIPPAPKGGAAYAKWLLEYKAKTPGQYVRALFLLGLTVIGLLALVAMVVGGIVYLTSAGSPERIKKAKSIIGGALAGLALLLCSYIILKLINPDLVQLKMPKLENVEMEMNAPSPPKTLPEQTQYWVCGAGGKVYSTKQKCSSNCKGGLAAVCTPTPKSWLDAHRENWQVEE